MKTKLDKCWCGSEVDDLGVHKTFPTENNWGGSYFRREGKQVVHEREKPKRR